MLLLDGILSGSGSILELLSGLSSSQILGTLGCHCESFIANLLLWLSLPLATYIGGFLWSTVVQISLPRRGLNDELTTGLSSIVMRFGPLQSRCTERRTSLALIGTLMSIHCAESYAQLAARIDVLWLCLILHLTCGPGLLVQSLVVPAEAS